MQTETKTTTTPTTTTTAKPVREALTRKYALVQNFKNPGARGQRGIIIDLLVKVGKPCSATELTEMVKKEGISYPISSNVTFGIVDSIAWHLNQMKKVELGPLVTVVNG